MYRTLLPFLFLLLLACGCSRQPHYIRYEGFAQGGTYHVTCAVPGRVTEETVRAKVDSVLREIDFSLSGYNKGSLLSQVNAGGDPCLNDLFITCFERSKAIWEETGGAFDPSCAPLFDLWGFGFANRGSVTQAAIDSIRQFTGMDLVSLETRDDGVHLVKADPRVRLNFNAIAQGFSCDVVAALLDSLGATDYLVDIGREIRCKGHNAAGGDWRVGLDSPFDGNEEEGRYLQAILEVTDCGIVTSGNYRKFYVENGQKFAHTIDPLSGRPVTHSLLSATVVAADATTADAYATWLMVVGPEQARAILAQRPDLEAMLVFEEEGEMKTFQTEHIKTQEIR